MQDRELLQSIYNQIAGQLGTIITDPPVDNPPPANPPPSSPPPISLPEAFNGAAWSFYDWDRPPAQNRLFSRDAGQLEIGRPWAVKFMTPAQPSNKFLRAVCAENVDQRSVKTMAVYRLDTNEQVAGAFTMGSTCSLWLWLGDVQDASGQAVLAPNVMHAVLITQVDAGTQNACFLDLLPG